MVCPEDFLCAGALPSVLEGGALTSAFLVRFAAASSIHSTLPHFPRPPSELYPCVFFLLRAPPSNRRAFFQILVLCMYLTIPILHGIVSRELWTRPPANLSAPLSPPAPSTGRESRRQNSVFPPFLFKHFRTLSFSVSCNSFVCHSYANFASRTVLRDENCRGVYQQFPFWDLPLVLCARRLSRVPRLCRGPGWAFKPFSFRSGTVESRAGILSSPYPFNL